MSNNFKKFANSFQAIARLRLEGISCLMRHLGNPQTGLKFIHVAGTNGKGSVCNFLQCIFSDAGYRTGRYTSPNLISVCERISVDGVLISDEDINRILSVVEEAARKVEAEIGDLPTQFEIWTAAAFCYFKEQKCDIVILETGLGGTRDATNVIPPPLASVITSIDIDHTEYLGDTIEQIAGEKAGIIKAPADRDFGLTVSAPQQPDAEKVLARVCGEQNNRLIIAGLPVSKNTVDFHEIFDYTTTDGKLFKDLECGIPGFYQPQNAAIAIETAHALEISETHIKSGIKAARNPGRFEVLRRDPVVIYDGAHNKNGMTALAQCLNRYFPLWQGATFIMAFMGDKDISGELEILKNNNLLDNSRIFVVKVKNNSRAADVTTVCNCAKVLGIDADPCTDLKTAYTNAISIGKPVILCGSLYLYKDLDECLRNNITLYKEDKNMQEYVIKKASATFCEDDWESANVADVNLNPWKEFTPEFKTTARVLYNSEAVFVRMETDEQPVVAKYLERNDPVCTDSCMEFFFCPNETDGRYFNFEFNALGTLNLSIGESLHDRKYIEDALSTFDIRPELFDGGWRISFKIPMEFIRKYVGEPTEMMHGNFQKCGSNTGHKHYGMWRAIETEKPDFHRPEFFGNLKFEK